MTQDHIHCFRTTDSTLGLASSNPDRLEGLLTTVSLNDGYKTGWLVPTDMPRPEYSGMAGSPFRLWLHFLCLSF